MRGKFDPASDLETPKDMGVRAVPPGRPYVTRQAQSGGGDPSIDRSIECTYLDRLDVSLTLHWGAWSRQLPI